MADIVAIHGIQQHRSSRQAMHDAWLAAIVEGLRNVRSVHADSLTLECAFYGHEYNDGKSGAEPSYAAIDVKPGFEEELVEAIAAALPEADSEGKKLYLPNTLQKALVAIQASRLFEGVDSVLISFVKQVHRYLTDAELQARVLEEFSRAMAGSPRLVIGHSLGSVVAYDWLQRNEIDSPPALITLGSPLGFEAIRRRRHQPQDRSRWPGRVPSWTNIAAGHDAVAMVKKLAALYHPDIVDQPCDNSRSAAHSAISYLKNVRTARAIDKALG
ncbi:hypothetical protein [Nocardia amikacinitolerans]|uniref:hypothetical protein n=1 Tax=Nocardia amikacinitolerans TaxID=756689 RepID=UPI0020A4AB3D|nr:hypothetical protein [Nocardia amikacinitolerans]MCP2279722.1 hypothetical protein [Nocardia amikacinitolerans]